MNAYRLTAGQIAAYGAYLRQEERAEGTIEKYLRDLAAFTQWLGESAVTREAPVQWKNHLLSLRYAPVTINSMLAALNGFFQFACKNYKGNTNEADIAKVMGFESNDEYNEIMFLREITHTVNAFNDMADIVRLYSKKPEMAEQRLENLLSEVLYEDSDSV